MDAIVIVLCIVIIFLVCFASRACGAHDASCMFLTKAQTRKFIMEDSDGFISNFDDKNLFSRGYVNTPALYITDSANSAASFTGSEKRVLRTLARQTDAYIRDPRSPVARAIGSRNAQLLARIPWKFAKTSGTVYENGLPHTRKDIIFLSDENFPTCGNVPTSVGANFLTGEKILLHEKMHLFTRYYKKETQDILRYYGFTPEQSLPPYEPIMHRQNPDTNSRVYFNPVIGKPLTADFYNIQPSHMHDTVNSASKEHPYEWLAYYVFRTVSE